MKRQKGDNSMSTSILPGERPDRLEEECAVFGVRPGETLRA